MPSEFERRSEFEGRSEFERIYHMSRKRLNIADIALRDANTLSKPWLRKALTLKKTLVLPPETPVRPAFEIAQATGASLIVAAEDGNQIVGVVFPNLLLEKFNNQSTRKAASFPELIEHLESTGAEDFRSRFPQLSYAPPDLFQCSLGGEYIYTPTCDRHHCPANPV